MNTALICVDVQNDFLPGGALGVTDGHKVIEPLKRLMDKVDVIVLTSDWHPEDHISFEDPPKYEDMSWPKHCVANTDGAEVDDDLWDAAMESGKPVLIVIKGDDKDREAYSGFQGRVVDVHNVDAHEPRALVFSDMERERLSLAQALRALSVTHIKIGGLALDYCVKATAIDARSSWGDTTVILDATRPVAYLTGAKAVAELSAAGVRVDARDHG
jgi:nicotinamidase/pyrazinamidase